jgi:DtxR family transcriptional regulator, Mn-dependent transcriptional regulator
MYLKAIWYLHEKGQDAKVSSIAKLLNVTQPSVVQMLHKLHNSNLVEYSQTKVTLTEDGRRIGQQMIRNNRLLEVMMKVALKIEVDEEMACGIEHHMKNIFTDALCALLKHPRNALMAIIFQRENVVINLGSSEEQLYSLVCSSTAMQQPPNQKS